MDDERTAAHFLSDHERPAIINCLSVVRSLRTNIGMDDEGKTDAELVQAFFMLDATDWVDDPTVDWSLVFSAISRPEAVAIGTTFPKTRESIQALLNELWADGRSGDAEHLRRAYGL